MKYRKKPIVVEAFKLEKQRTNWPDWANEALANNVITNHTWEEYPQPLAVTFIVIKTLEGSLTASVGDYIIKGIDGEIYSCKPRIFEASYELMESSVVNETNNLNPLPDNYQMGN